MGNSAPVRAGGGLEHQWLQGFTDSFNVSHPTCPVLGAGAMSRVGGTARAWHDSLGLAAGPVYGRSSSDPGSPRQARP